MKIKHENTPIDKKLPMQFSISFDNLFSTYKKYADKKYEKHPFHNYAKQMVNEIQKYRNWLLLRQPTDRKDRLNVSFRAEREIFRLL